VTVEHRQLARYVANVNQWLDLPAGAGYAMVSTVAADLGHTSLFGGLVAGGTLHLLPDEQVGDPDAVADYFARHSIDCLKIVPSHLSALLSGSRPADVLPRKRLVVGGEALSWELVEQIQRLAPDCAILNEYGPTETTVGTIVYQAPAGASASGAAGVPIGTPYPLVTAYALDAHLEPTPVGVPGELYIGGAQGARGYLGRPDLTADRFMPDPFSSAPGARMYRTGDRVRWRADGRLEYLGRGDDQVKIRGFRVELGEVESAIRQHAGVREALVLARQDTPGDLRLVAYVVPMRSDEAPSVVREIQDLLKTQLPHYMLPGAFVPLAGLPLTANGKIDRAALPAPDPNAAAHTLYVAPRGAVERVLAAIWAEVLHVERVGVHDNFFELGGHSLLATRVVSRVRKAFGVGLPLRSLMEMATVAQFAELLVANEPKPGHVERVARAHLKLQSMSADEVRQALAHRKRA
jgi:acyl-coenzyme A synthetase/AMP-(fatty) acid ligase/acyl carrier protein